MELLDDDALAELAAEQLKGTLLMFDARGQKVDTGVGLQEKDEVRDFLQRHAEG